MPNRLVRVGLHLQMLKFGPLYDPTRPLLVDNVTNKKVVDEALKHHISRIGIELSYAENRALFAVQRLLDNTGYKGNVRAIKVAKGNPYKLSDTQFQPVLEVGIAEYLNVYGVHKAKTSRQKQEYSTSGRESALAALKSLAEKYFLLVYTRRIYHETEKRKGGEPVVIETVDTLIKLERSAGRLKIIPSPILFDQEDTYYMILPADLYTGVISDRQRSQVLFIEYLFYHYEQVRRRTNRSYTLGRRMEVMAQEIGLGQLLISRQRSKLRKILNAYYELAMQRRYLTKYEIDAEGARYAKVDKLYIRAKTMNDLRKVAEEEREDDEDPV